MADSKFRRALNYSFLQEIDEAPSQYELERKYVFSQDFEEKMKKLIKDVNRKYFVVAGFVLPKYTIGVVVMIAVAVAVLTMRYKNIIDRSTARFIFSLSEITILAIFGVSTRQVGHNMTRTMQTGFTDFEDEAQQQYELEFPVPVSPLNYSKSGEYRTTTLHTIQYKDIAGRLIDYERVNISDGVLTKIDTPEQINSCKVHHCEAIWFEKGNEIILVWADDFYRYILKGVCDIDVLIKMAESIYK